MYLALPLMHLALNKMAQLEVLSGLEDVSRRLSSVKYCLSGD